MEKIAEDKAKEVEEVRQKKLISRNKISLLQ